MGAETIRLRTGLLSRKEVDVPLGRVQALDIVHGPVQRVFGVRGVHVQTAGGGKAGEITLPAVAAGRRRAAPRRDPRAAARRAAAVDAAPLAERRLTRGDLLLAALTAGQLGVILPVLAVVAAGAAGDVVRAGHPARRRGGPAARAGVGARVDPRGARRCCSLAWLLSIAGAVLAFAGFTVARDDDRLRLRRGLLSRREATVPVARVQAVRVVEGLLRRPFGLVTVRAEVAGYAKEAAAAQTLFPLLRRARGPPVPRGGPARAGRRRRRARGRAAPGAAALRAAARRAGARSPAAPPACSSPARRRGRCSRRVPAAALGAAQWRAAGWRIRDGRTAFRFRRLARVTVLAPAARLQEHGVRQTVLQRPGRGWRTSRCGWAPRPRARVRHLDEEVAGRVFDALRA